MDRNRKHWIIAAAMVAVDVDRLEFPAGKNNMNWQAWHAAL